MADRLCEFCIGCCSKICAVFCREISMKTAYIIQFTVYSVLQGYNVASDIGMFFDVFYAVKKCNKIESASGMNGTQVDPGGSNSIYCRDPGNFTISDLDKHTTTLEILQWFFLIFAGIGAGLYIAHICTLLPNLCKHCREPEFEQEVDSLDTPKYYRSILHIHTVFMCLETFVHDIPVSCLAVELSVHYFGPANCWECAASASSIPAELSLVRSSLWIGLKVSAVALITIYKGKPILVCMHTIQVKYLGEILSKMSRVFVELFTKKLILFQRAKRGFKLVFILWKDTNLLRLYETPYTPPDRDNLLMEIFLNSDHFKD